MSITNRGMLPGAVRDQKATRPVGGRVVFLGDSITQAADDVTNAVWDGGSWPLRLLAASNGRLIGVRNSGVGGDTTAAMVARFAADVAAYTPDIVIIMGGTNDVGTGVAQATTIANLTTLIDSTRAFGGCPVLCTIAPRGTGTSPSGLIATTVALNHAIRSLARTKNVPLIDMFAALVSTIGDGCFASANNADNTHPTKAGYALMATAAWTTLSTLPIAGVAAPTFSGDAGNLVGNGVFTTGSATYPTGWSYGGGSGTVARTIDGTDFVGYRFDMTCASTLSISQSATISSGISAGNRLLMVARIKWAPSDANMQGHLRLQGGILSDIFFPAGSAAVGPTTVAVERIAGTPSSPYVQMTVNSGVGVYTVGQLGLYNLTTLGLA